MKKLFSFGVFVFILSACTHHGARMPQAWVDKRLDKEANDVDRQFLRNEELNKQEQEKQGH